MLEIKSLLFYSKGITKECVFTVHQIYSCSKSYSVRLAVAFEAVYLIYSKKTFFRNAFAVKKQTFDFEHTRPTNYDHNVYK